MTVEVWENWLQRCTGKYGVSEFAKFAVCAAYSWRLGKSRISFSEKQCQFGYKKLFFFQINFIDGWLSGLINGWIFVGNCMNCSGALQL